jgi:hypothetical protein
MIWPWSRRAYGPMDHGAPARSSASGLARWVTSTSPNHTQSTARPCLVDNSDPTRRRGRFPPLLGAGATRLTRVNLVEAVMARKVVQCRLTMRRMMAKKNWKDIGDLRLPNPKWRLGRAAAWFALQLGLPPGALVFRRPDGSVARSDKTLGALRLDWDVALRQR